MTNNPPGDKSAAKSGSASQSDLDWLSGNAGKPAQPEVKPPAKPPISPAQTASPAPRIVSAPGTYRAPTPPPPPVSARPAKPPTPPSAPAKVKTRTPRGRKVRRVVITCLVALALWAGFLAYAPFHAWNAVGSVPDTPAGTRPPVQPGTAILIVGTDSRENLTAQQKKDLGVGSASGGRTDVMMLYYIPPHGDPALISLPRDSYLPIPGHKKNKLNAAYSFGGAPLLIQTVEDATGLRIDGYLEVAFDGFVQMVDLVGGVQVCLDKPMVDKDAHINLPAGCQMIDGTKALGYVRQRHQDPLGDLGRVQRQREIMTKVIAKLARPSTVLNPVQYWRTCQAMTNIFEKGQSTTSGQAFTAVLSALQFARGNVISLTVPVSNSNARTSAGSSVLWDTTKAKTLFGMLAQGDTSQLGQFK